MHTGQAHVRHLPHLLRPRRLRHEPLETRHLLSAVSGTVFEDLDADGVIDVGEPGLEGWTVVLDRIDTLQAFANPRPDPDDGFGSAVIATADKVVIGARYDDTDATDAGIAYVYDLGGNLLHTLHNPTPDADDQFGWHFAVNGDKLLVGVNRDDTGTVGAGVVHLFDVATGNLLHTIINPNPEPDAFFGYSLAFVDNDILVASRGTVYLFDGTNYALKQTFTNPTPETGEMFGHFVAAYGDDVLVADPVDNSAAPAAGAVYHFDAESGDLVRTFTNPTPTPNASFGIAVAVRDDHLLIGAQLDDTLATDTGAAYVFDGTNGTLLQTLSNPTPNAGDKFGWPVAFVGDYALVGTAGDDTAGTDAGAVYLFDVAT
jgi:FG-GAP repeat protein